MRRQSEASLVIVLLPIFLVGMFPMLLMVLLGFAGLALFGALLMCAALSDTLRAHSDFNREVIEHGLASRERAVHASGLNATNRFAMLTLASGAALAAAGIAGLIWQVVRF
jgi:hypothetical protein